MKTDSVRFVDYPTCSGSVTEIAAGEMRSTDAMPGQHISERWSLSDRGCYRVLTVHQEWERQVTDVELLYDEDYRPLRAWKRMIIPGSRIRPDTRVYFLDRNPVEMIRVSSEGRQEYTIPGGRPVAVVAPGRAMLGPWVRANAGLRPGDVVRGPVLDLRQLIERVDEVALRRDDNRDGFRVYTFFGRESVFFDEKLRVVGDLAGMREGHLVLGFPEEALPDPTQEL